MRWNLATKQQLLTICLDENCPIAYKFEAANEYKRRDGNGFRDGIKKDRLKRHIGR